MFCQYFAPSTVLPFPLRVHPAFDPREKELPHVLSFRQSRKDAERSLPSPISSPFRSRRLFVDFLFSPSLPHFVRFPLLDEILGYPGVHSGYCLISISSGQRRGVAVRIHPTSFDRPLTDSLPIRWYPSPSGSPATRLDSTISSLPGSSTRGTRSGAPSKLFAQGRRRMLQQYVGVQVNRVNKGREEYKIREWFVFSLPQQNSHFPRHRSTRIRRLYVRRYDNAARGLPTQASTPGPRFGN